MKQQQEVLDRIRRVETRVTKIGNHLGVDVGGGKPRWDEARQRVVLPSPGCSISEVVGMIPDTMRGEIVNVFVGDDYLTSIAHPRL